MLRQAYSNNHIDPTNYLARLREEQVHIDYEYRYQTKSLQHDEQLQSQEFVPLSLPIEKVLPDSVRMFQNLAAPLHINLLYKTIPLSTQVGSLQNLPFHLLATA